MVLATWSTSDVVFFGALGRAALFGFYSGLFGITLVVQSRRRELSTIATVSVVVVYLLSIAYHGLVFAVLYLKVIDGQYGETSCLLFGGISLLYVASTFTVDLFVSWRLWIVFDKTQGILRIISPFVVVGIVASVVYMVFNVLECLPQTTTETMWTVYKDSSAILLGLTLVYNWLASGLIIWKIHRVARHVEDTTATKLYRAVASGLIQGGAIYSIPILIYILSIPLVDGLNTIVAFSSQIFAGLVPLLALIHRDAEGTTGEMSSVELSSVTNIRFAHYTGTTGLEGVHSGSQDTARDFATAISQ